MRKFISTNEALKLARKQNIDFTHSYFNRLCRENDFAEKDGFRWKVDQKKFMKFIDGKVFVNCKAMTINCCISFLRNKGVKIHYHTLNSKLKENGILIKKGYKYIVDEKKFDEFYERELKEYCDNIEYYYRTDEAIKYLKSKKIKCSLNTVERLKRENKTGVLRVFNSTYYHRDLLDSHVENGFTKNLVLQFNTDDQEKLKDYSHLECIMLDSKKYYRLSEITRHFNDYGVSVHPSTVNHWIKTYNIPAVKHGQKWLIQDKTLNKIIDGKIRIR